MSDDQDKQPFDLSGLNMHDFNNVSSVLQPKDGFCRYFGQGYVEHNQTAPFPDNVTRKCVGTDEWDPPY